MQTRNDPRRTYTLTDARLSEFVRQSGGVADVFIVCPEDCRALLQAMQAGIPAAVRLGETFIAFMKSVLEAGDGADARLCGSCDVAIIEVPFSAIFVAQSRDDTTDALCFGICGSCASDRATIREKAIATIRLLVPDVRPIDTQGHAGGRA